MRTATSTDCSGRRGDSHAGARRIAGRCAIAAIAACLAGCVAYEPVYAPQPLPKPLPKAPPVTPPYQRGAPPPFEDPLASLPQDQEGLGRGPLGRAGVLLDRAIVATERAQQRGEPIDTAQLAHLRMTRQARDLIATGDSERAADLLERAIGIDDGAGFGYLYLAYVHLAAGRPDQADVFLDRAAALLPPDPALRVEIQKLRARADSVPLAAGP